MGMVTIMMITAATVTNPSSAIVVHAPVMLWGQQKGRAPRRSTLLLGEESVACLADRLTRFDLEYLDADVAEMLLQFGRCSGELRHGAPMERQHRLQA
jgi:hypothetical protein